MSDRTRKIYDAIVEGAQAGLTDKAPFKYVIEQCHKATSKKVVKASLLALSDPDLKDPNILHTIYALAIKHRLYPWSKDDVEEPDMVTVDAPKQGKRTSKKPVDESANPAAP